MLKDKKFGMISLGCDKNRVDAEKLLGVVKAKGFTITEDISDAEILIVNTCAFLDIARQEAIDTILDCDSYRGGKLEKIVVSGCLPQKYVQEVFPSLEEGDVFIGCNDADKLIEGLELSYKEQRRVNFVGQGGKEEVERLLTTPQHFAYLKIAEGCNNKCTFCLIPKIRGKYKSVPIEKLVNEAKNLGDIQELILVAQDTTRYGEDIYGENKFVTLIQKLSQLENIAKIRLFYCYPDMITDELLDEIANNDKIIKYLDIPLQHSENRILKLMLRDGSKERYQELLNKMRVKIPNIAIRSTFIAGFPSETEEEHRAMQAFLKENKLTNCGFFPYSREEETAAYHIKGQLSKAVKEKRVKALYATQREISKNFCVSFIGKEIEVLCDGIDFEKNQFVGRAYFQAPEVDGKVYFTAKQAMQGKKYKVYITEADEYDLYGECHEFTE